MGRLKDYFDTEINDDYRREFIEEPFNMTTGTHTYIISVTVNKPQEIYSLLMEAYKDIIAGEIQGGLTKQNKNGENLTYGFRKI